MLLFWRFRLNLIGTVDRTCKWYALYQVSFWGNPHSYLFRCAGFMFSHHPVLSGNCTTASPQYLNRRERRREQDSFFFYLLKLSQMPNYSPLNKLKKPKRVKTH